MRFYNDLTIDTLILTACCEAYAVGPDGQHRKRQSQLVSGEILVCEGCGDTSPELVEHEVAWD